MKKEKSIYILGFKKLKELNQIMKEICSVYIFDNAGLVLTSNGEDLGLEKIGMIDPEAMNLLAPFSNRFINCAEMFEFTKTARISSLNGREESANLYLEDHEHDALIKLSQYLDNSHPFSIKDVNNLHFAKKFFVYDELRHPDELVRQIQQVPYLEESVIHQLKNNVVVWIPVGRFSMTLSRELFPTISKCDQLRYLKVRQKDSIVYILFEETYIDLMTIYTITGFLDYG